MYKDKRLSWDDGSITVGNKGKRSVFIEVESRLLGTLERVSIKYIYSIKEIKEVIALLMEYLEKAEEC